MDLIFSGRSLNLADSQHPIHNSWNVLVAIRRWFVVVGKWLARHGHCVPSCSPVPSVVIWLPAGRRYTGWIYTSFKAGVCVTAAVHWLSLMFVFTFCFTKNSPSRDVYCHFVHYLPHAANFNMCVFMCILRLTLEQKELCRSRLKLLSYLDRLATYEVKIILYRFFLAIITIWDIWFICDDGDKVSLRLTCPSFSATARLITVGFENVRKMVRGQVWFEPRPFAGASLPALSGSFPATLQPSNARNTMILHKSEYFILSFWEIWFCLVPPLHPRIVLLRTGHGLFLSPWQLPSADLCREQCSHRVTRRWSNGRAKFKMELDTKKKEIINK